MFDFSFFIVNGIYFLKKNKKIAKQWSDYYFEKFLIYNKKFS